MVGNGKRKCGAGEKTALHRHTATLNHDFWWEGLFHKPKAIQEATEGAEDTRSRERGFAAFEGDERAADHRHHHDDLHNRAAVSTPTNANHEHDHQDYHNYDRAKFNNSTNQHHKEKRYWWLKLRSGTEGVFLISGGG